MRVGSDSVQPFFTQLAAKCCLENKKMNCINTSKDRILFYKALNTVYLWGMVAEQRMVWRVWR